MKFLFTYLISLLFWATTSAQLVFGTPNAKDIPKKLLDLKKEISVLNYPNKIDPVKIKNRYYWKHNTIIFSKNSKVKITEFGAYLFYNGKWNLRKSYPIKKLNKNFNTKKETLEKSQPYTWNNNWRTDSRLYGGWALWYFIGTNNKGETVCGYEMIHTTNQLNK